MKRNEHEEMDFKPIALVGEIPKAGTSIVLSGKLPKEFHGQWTFLGLNPDGSYRLRRDHLATSAKTG